MDFRGGGLVRDTPIMPSAKSFLRSIRQGLKLYLILLAWFAVALLSPSRAHEPLTFPKPVLEAHTHAETLAKRGLYLEAIPFAEKALDQLENELGPGHILAATLVNELARFYELVGRYREAGNHYKRALAIVLRELGADHAATAVGFGNLANLYRLQGRYSEAEALFTTALRIGFSALGPDDSDLARITNNLALLYVRLGRYQLADKLYSQSAAVLAKGSNLEESDAVIAMLNSASFYYRLGHYRDAEKLYQQGLEIQETRLGPTHPDIAKTLANLGQVFRARGAFSESEALLKRALEITESKLGKAHPSVAEYLNILSTLYFDIDRYVEAERMLLRALDVRKQALGTQSIGVAEILHNLSAVYFRLGRIKKSEDLQLRAWEIKKSVLGADHSEATDHLHTMGEIKRARGQLAEAERYHSRALQTREEIFGADHLELAYSHLKLALVYMDMSAPSKALKHIRKSTRIRQSWISQRNRAPTTREIKEQAAARPIFLEHLKVLQSCLEPDNVGDCQDRTENGQALLDEAFEVAQLAEASRTGWDVAQMAARFSARDQQLAEIVRRRQDALRYMHELDTRLLEVLTARVEYRDVDTERPVRSEIRKVRRQIADFNRILNDQFPDYFLALNLRPQQWPSVQATLQPGEALLLFQVSESETFLWIGTQTGADLLRLDIGREELNRTVSILRLGLDLAGRNLKQGFPRYDIELAYRLYSKILLPAERLLQQINHIIVIPDEGLQSLPLGVLVTESHQITPDDGLNYQTVPWLALKYAISVVPSVSAFAALRSLPRGSRAPNPFIGFGDPLLEGKHGGLRGIDLSLMFRDGPVADVTAVRALPPLPETAKELRILARILGAKSSDVYLKTKATESRVRSMKLDNYKVIAFATHGLLASQTKLFDGKAEPAFVLTPPIEGSTADDGLLTASEIAQLKLDADWAILSACNTASADGTPGAEGLSGLARAFFYAGVRTLLVSHWPVASDAAPRLTTGLFKAISEDPAIGRAEALRRSIRTMLANPTVPYHSHPFAWGPFSVVGEGGSYALAKGLQRTNR